MGGECGGLPHSRAAWEGSTGHHTGQPGREQRDLRTEGTSDSHASLHTTVWELLFIPNPGWIPEEVPPQGLEQGHAPRDLGAHCFAELVQWLATMYLTLHDLSCERGGEQGRSFM